MQTYRQSHISPGKGYAYSESFHKLPYRRYLWEWEKKVLKEVLQKYFQECDPINYLDFACGTGRILGHLEPMVGKSMGVDVSEAMLEVGRQNVRKSTCVKADLTEKNILLGEHFDLITAFRFFLNAEQELRDKVLQVMADLISPGGRLVFNVHMNETSTLAILKRLNHMVTRRQQKFNTMSIDHVRKMVARHGFEVQDIYHFGIVPVKMSSKRLPIQLINLIEAPASRLAISTYFSSQLIFVCKPN